jgi:hypothetical protein
VNLGAAAELVGEKHSRTRTTYEDASICKLVILRRRKSISDRLSICTI